MEPPEKFCHGIKGIISFFVLQFFIVLVSIEDVADFYSLDILINGINDTIFSLINAEAFKSLIVEILEFLAVLRLRGPTQ
jgi:hypothetical protein